MQSLTGYYCFQQAPGLQPLQGRSGAVGVTHSFCRLHPLWGSTHCMLVLTSQIKETDRDTPLAHRVDILRIPHKYHLY